MVKKPSPDINHLRPKRFNEYLGQKKIIESLKLFVEAAKKRGQTNEHLLFYGPPGIGKTTLAYVVANELGGEMRVTSGAAIQKTGDLAAILTNLNKNDVFFIDEIHRLPKPVEEILYPVLEESVIDLVIGKGPTARNVRLPIAPITIIGSTTKLALLSAPLRDRFGLVLRLDYYSNEEMFSLVKRSANLLNLKLTDSIIKEVVNRSRKTPRIANRILKRLRDLYEVENFRILTIDQIKRFFKLLEIDSLGLTSIDLKYLKFLSEKFFQTPVGIETISSGLAEDQRTVEEFIEPYLIQIGFIKKTPRGRQLTQKALQHLKETLL